MMVWPSKQSNFTSGYFMQFHSPIILWNNCLYIHYYQNIALFFYVNNFNATLPNQLQYTPIILQ
jgi:hypothetical protein